MEPFDLLGELPTGTTVLEASAGTGKTYALAGLVTRYVAEGAATLDEMLLITFGRAASQELRERVRDQLTGAERALADPEPWREDTGLLGHLVRLDDPRGRPRPAARRAGRLRRRHHRHHPPVLPAGAALARRRGRHRRRRHPGRRPGRAGGRGRRRPLPAALRRLRGRAAVHPRHRARDRHQGGRQPAHHAGPAGVRRGVGRGCPGRLRAGRARGDGAPQAPARHPRLRRPADPAGRRARGPGRPGPAADAPALVGGDGRRVPGHRPGPVEGHRRRLQRAQHPGPHR